jgi:hypothetical protein
MIITSTLEMALPPYTDGCVAKLFSENRERYIAQSAATHNGVVAPLPAPKSNEGEVK